MDIVELIAINGLFPAVIVGLALWKSDGTVLSQAGSDILYGEISSTIKDPAKSKIPDIIKSYARSYLAPSDGYLNYFFRVFLYTLVSLLVLLAIYTVKTPDLYAQLSSHGFLRQFFLQGFVVVYLVNVFLFISYPLIENYLSGAGAYKILMVIFSDILLKIILFILFTIITYCIFADFYGAFSGSKLLAVKAVANTMLLAVKFENLTAVYLYSIIISSFPFFVIFFIKLMVSSKSFSAFIQKIMFWLPFEKKPLRTITVLFAIFFGVFSLLISLLMEVLFNTH